MRTSASLFFLINGLLAVCLIPPARAALTKPAELALDDGLKHLYGLDYEKSRAAFRAVVEKEPDNPFGYLFEAGAIWWQSSMEYGLFKDTPTLQGLFEQDVEAAIRKADAVIDGPKPGRADGYFVMGMALGTRGQWGLMRGHYVKAYFDGKKAIKQLKKALKLDNEYYDAELGLGVFDYQSAQMSGVLKTLSAVGGVRGDEKRGLEKLHLASEKGKYGHKQATEMLMMIYFHDKRDYASALPLLERLRKDFPESVLFMALEAAVRDRTGDTEGSLALGKELFKSADADYPAFRKKLLSLTCGALAERCFEPTVVGQIAKWLDAAIERQEKDLAAAKKPAKGRKPSPETQAAERYLSLLRLYRAQAHDLLGRREASDADYRKVLAGPDVSDAKPRAKECLARLCDAKNQLSYLRALSRGDAWDYGSEP